MDTLKGIFQTFNPDVRAYPSAKAFDTAAKSYAASVTTNLPPAARAAILQQPMEAIQLVDPANNTIGGLAIIDTLLRGQTPPSTPRALILDEALRFLLQVDPVQIRYVGPLFKSLLDDANSYYTPKVAVELLSNAILRIDPSGTVFTSTHLNMAKLAYDANCIEPALKVFDADILYYARPTASTRLELNDPALQPQNYIPAAGLTDTVKSTSVLEYHFLQAMAYISRRDWSKAQLALERVIGHPTKDKGVSKIMAECYKKWLLVGVLRDGKPPTLPSYITSSTKSIYFGLSEAYNSIASLFPTDGAAALKEEFEKRRAVWEEDQNLSLLEEVLVSYQKWQIINLRRIYHQVSIAQIRQTTLSATTAETLKDDGEVLMLISEMIESEMLKGQLQIGSTAGESYLTFHEEYTSMTEGEFAAEVARCHASIEALTKQYRATNERLGTTKEYARHVLREQKRMEKDTADAGVGFDMNVEDEDLMTGVLGSV
ncbi:hypothetical protein BBK36DRAFT_1111728 [Trichoderma citrinoviride]|uniref:COP9 signalosome complex subunit 3 N-terminal helical repeats domain-containing protein n=1 Tax=Trichoderma citrinoviride TaxID=58853 RepID=A0A2T4BKA3_9HYPO|nr:hypothetical protein BBK36DRAFT_1111728 [Trichoderma citrinoviride]PTB69738.1 hypothetical protein BBK36DRAFT_1111728 [Trichoderma citrinoviride]